MEENKTVTAETAPETAQPVAAPAAEETVAE